MASSNNKKKKQSQSTSPTFKAGLIMIIALFVVWGIMSIQDSFVTDEGTNEDDYQTSLPIITNEESEQGNASAQNQDYENNQQENREESSTNSEENEAQEQQQSASSEEETSSDVSQEADLPVIGGENNETTTAEEATGITYSPATEAFDYNIDATTLDGTKHSWSFKRNTDHSKVVGYNEGIKLDSYDAYYIAPTDEKVVYLTFDEGYENGYTSQILDTLKANNVKAAFFVTEPYVRSQPELLKRMIDEGHIVANHSVHHYDGSSGDGTALTEITPEKLISELEGVKIAVKEETGYDIDLFFRPPAGLFSDKTLYVTRQQGYKTIFWSMAYSDWNVNNQPGKEYAYDHVMSNYHPGAIILLHAVSESNTEALDDIIKGIQSEGYRFGTLNELPSNFTN